MSKLVVIIGLLFGLFGHAAPRTITLTERNTIAIEEITTSASRDFALKLAGLLATTKGEEPIYYIVVASPGGRVLVAAEIIQVLKMIEPSGKFVIFCRDCESAGAAIFVSYPGKKLVSETSKIMMHEMTTTVATINLPKVDLKYELALNNAFNSIFYTPLKMKKEEFEERIKDKMWIMRGPEMVKKKLADELVQVKCDEIISELFPVTCGLKEAP